MADLVSVLALVISISSVVIVAIREGSKLIFDFRESELTLNRKKETEKVLQEELKQKMSDFFKSQDATEEDKFDTLELLGYYSYLARSFTKNVLDSALGYTKSMLRWFSLAIISSALVVTLEIVVVEPMNNINVLIFLGVYFAIIPVFCFSTTIQKMNKANFLRETFRKIYEKPELCYCEELHDELVAKNLV